MDLHGMEVQWEKQVREIKVYKPLLSYGKINGSQDFLTGSARSNTKKQPEI